METRHELPHLPFPIADITDIAPGYRALRDKCPISQVRTAVGDVAWLVTGYHQAKALFGDERFGRAHPDPDNAPRLSDSVLGAPIGNYETEQDDHNRLRKLIAPAFSARRMQALRPRVEEITNELLDRITTLDRPVDLHRELSYPLPVQVICELLGVPPRDHDKVKALSAAINRLDDREASAAGLGDLMEYMFELIEEKKHCPADDVISEMVAADEGWGQIALVAALLLYTGHETTVTRIDYGTLLLLRDRSQWDAIRDDPALIPRAVEEILRFATTGNGTMMRYARTDVDVDGVRIQAGDAVMLAAAVANRDAQAFADADRFDITRQPNQHLSFGYGRYFCVGASLARIELQVVLGALTKRFPTLRLAVPPDRLRLRTEVSTCGVAELPVTW
jgi:pentalenolactone synthase